MTTRVAPRRTRDGDARGRAAWVLVRVEEDGAYAAPALDAALQRTPVLSDEDRALATTLVYGVLRSSVALDARLARYVKDTASFAKLEPYARAVMRVAAYQLLALDRIPARAVVHDAVERIKRDRSVGLSRFANAVLRRLAEECARAPIADADVVLACESVPSAVVADIAQIVGGHDAAREVVRAVFAQRHGTCLRANVLRESRDELLAWARIQWPNATVQRGAVSPWAVRVMGAGDVSRHAEHATGRFSVQEEGAQCVALAADVRPGMRVLDVCAGRGGKTAALATQLRGDGLLHAVELHPERLSRIDAELRRLGIAPDAIAYRGAAADLTRGFGALTNEIPRDGYDVVLVDAPCTGWGTMAHRPDLLTRRRALDRQPLVELQRAILDRVAPCVRSGGTLLYAVCTLSRAEGRAQMDWLREKHPRFEPYTLSNGSADVPVELRGAEIVLRPDVHGTDGFMMFRVRAR